MDEIPPEARDTYQPFETIREIEINWDGEPVRMRPLVILDDVHTLHPEQFEALFRALTRRVVASGSTSVPSWRTLTRKAGRRS